jgi:hypothetical protein
VLQDGERPGNGHAPARNRLPFGLRLPQPQPVESGTAWYSATRERLGE